ncbi:wax ester/triacylglycerol synthase domain-containing protein [Actinomadura sp. 21ATH]|uniref:wax ester/triacylglycerol synthase domain-containing protein n=1 Tax=Actinomadura sp. 21ATH TaxID=1735444 RepID=UPI0035C1C014
MARRIISMLGRQNAVAALLRNGGTAAAPRRSHSRSRSGAAAGPPPSSAERGGRPLSPLDMVFWSLAAPPAPDPMTFGFWARIEGSPPALKEFAGTVRRRLAPLEILRYSLAPSSGRPQWIALPGFDPAAHVSARVAAAGEAGLRARLAELLAQNLPLSGRPPWRIDLVEGYSEDEFTVLVRTHHALMDGVSNAHVLQRLLDRDGAQPLPECGAAPTLREVTRRERLAVTGASLPSIGRSSLTGPPGQGRHLAWATLPRAAMERARTGGATLNDVYLALVAGALSRTLGPDAARAVRHISVPSDVRAPGGLLQLGNGASPFRIEPPLGRHRLGERIQAVRERTARAKHGDLAAAVAANGASAAARGRRVQAPAARYMTGGAYADVICSNTPIPPGAHTWHGRAVLGIYGTTLVSPSTGLGIMLHGHGEDVTISVYADSRQARFADRLADAITEEAASLP